MTFSIQIGAARIHQVTELDRWPFVAAELFPTATPAMVQQARAQLLPPLVDTADGQLVLAIHTYVVQLGDRTVLIDAGNGSGKQRPNLLAHHMLTTEHQLRLRAAGVTPEHVDVVIATHLHPDHCGGATVNVDGSWVPAFPNAVHLFSNADLTWLAHLAAMPPASGAGADLARTYQDSVRPILDTAQWRTVEDGFVIAEHGGTSLVVRATPGHTAGHLSVELQHNSGGAVFAGDVIHHPIQLLFPDLSQAGDSDPVTARRTRTRLLDRCIADDLLLLTTHFAVDMPLRVTAGDHGPVISALLIESNP